LALRDGGALVVSAGGRTATKLTVEKI